MMAQQNASYGLQVVKKNELNRIEPSKCNIVQAYKIDSLQQSIGENMFKLVVNQYRLMNKSLSSQKKAVYKRLCLQSNESTVCDLKLLNNYLREKMVEAITDDNRRFAEIGKAIIARQHFAQFANIDNETKLTIRNLLRNTKLIIKRAQKRA